MHSCIYCTLMEPPFSWNLQGLYIVLTKKLPKSFDWQLSWDWLVLVAIMLGQACDQANKSHNNSITHKYKCFDKYMDIIWSFQYVIRICINKNLMFWKLIYCQAVKLSSSCLTPYNLFHHSLPICCGNIRHYLGPSTLWYLSLYSNIEWEDMTSKSRTSNNSKYRKMGIMNQVDIM